MTSAHSASLDLTGPISTAMSPPDKLKQSYGRLFVC